MGTKMTEVDWQRLKNLTDAEIEAAAKDDPDCYLPTDEELQRGTMMAPLQEPIMISLPIDYRTVQWLQEHRIDIVPAVQKMLHAFVEAHGGK